MSGETMVESYPLYWPEHQPRVAPSKRRRASFKVTFGEAINDLRAEVERMGGSELIVSSNVKSNRSGMPYTDQREPEDPGVAIYFKRKGEPVVIACDTYNLVRFNIRAIGLTLESLRAIERHASSRLMEQAFRGFKALPAATAADPPWYDVLGLEPEATLQEIAGAHMRLAVEHHPDKGGDTDKMAQINRARDKALEERGA